MTNTSFTAMQAMVSMPFALKLSMLPMNPGRCFASQVGVNAPGTEKSTTFLPLKSSSVETARGPSFVIVLRVPEGIRSPALIAIADESPRSGAALGARTGMQCPQSREFLHLRIALHFLEA